MKILALNCGSSSLKYQLYDWDERHILSSGVVERLGTDGSFIKHEAANDVKKIERKISDHTEAINLIVECLTHNEYGVLKSMNEISAVGHRVVHGGEKFVCSVEITDELLDSIKELSHLAPLHNPANLDGILAAQKVLPDVKQIGIYDTAFHQTMPDYAYIYPLPYDWYRKAGVRRYGFHGTSHLYVSKRAAVMLGKDARDCNVITLHIGNGVSHCAIKNGESVDTSMGLTPLEGAVMGTRCGDIDPAIPTFVQNALNMSADEVNSALNKNSGILGITEKYTDRRDVLSNMDKDDKCRLAIEIEAYRVRKYVGSYMAVLGRVDAIVFTAGVGENVGLIRQLALENLENLGISIDFEKNKNTFSKHGETEISTPDSKVKVFVIPTNEELVFIEDVVAILNGTYKHHLDQEYSFKQ